ncbi:MAG: alpha/beta fold hydrolase [Verrucomicrobiota bacterium]
MNKVLVVFGVSVFLLLLILVFGPRVKVGAVSAPQVPHGDLDAYLARAEGRYDDIIKGVEKRIVWADASLKGKTEYAVVYIHGFGASSPETRPFADRVAERLGANLFFTRLSGHGRTSEAFSKSKAAEWLSDGLEAYEIGKRLGDKVVVIGGSTGATVGLWVAERLGEGALEALVMMSPNFGPKDARAEWLNAPWAKQVLPQVLGDSYSWSSENEVAMKYCISSYRVDVIFEMMALVRRVRGLDLGKVNTSVLCFYSMNDIVVDQSKTIRVLRRLGGKRVEAIEVRDASDPKNHVLMGDIWPSENLDWMVEKAVGFVGCDEG